MGCVDVGELGRSGGRSELGRWGWATFAVAPLGHWLFVGCLVGAPKGFFQKT